MISNHINYYLLYQVDGKKIDIISIQEYDRETNEYRNEPILADDENGIIYQMKKAYEESL